MLKRKSADTNSATAKEAILSYCLKKGALVAGVADLDAIERIGPMLGKELVEQLPERNYLELWQACFTSAGISCDGVNKRRSSANSSISCPSPE